MPLDSRAEAQQLSPLGFAPDDRMRVGNRDRCELEPLVSEVERLHLPHLHRAKVQGDSAIAAYERVHLALAHLHAHAVGLSDAGEPGGDDAGAVSRQLRRRTVWIPDPELR